jgi:hypothetical protein
VPSRRGFSEADSEVGQFPEPLECSALVRIGVGGPRVDPFGQPLVGSKLAERGVEVDHVTIYRWVQRFTPLLADAARPCRHRGGDRWFVDETYVKVGGRWRYVYRAIDQFGQVIDV